MSATAIFPSTSSRRSAPITIPLKADVTANATDKPSLFLTASTTPSLSLSDNTSLSSLTVSTANNSYREIIRQLAAQSTTKPYGDIPIPSSLVTDSKKKKQQQQITTRSNNVLRNNKRPTQKLVRRMSHVEDWIVVDSKESLPDEQELIVPSLSIRNLFSDDLFTEVLPLHMPPPSLSRTSVYVEDGDFGQEETEGVEEEEEEEELPEAPLHNRRQSISSTLIQKSSPTSSTTVSYALSSSPPQLLSNEWKETLAKLKKSLLTPSSPSTNVLSRSFTIEKNIHNGVQAEIPKYSKSLSTVNANMMQKKKWVPMPIPPKRPTGNAKRRSEATTQPRFNPDTNTYLRDTRSNSDHLRMISAELNMMRCKKLLSPLKPRGFLPRRKDAFVRGEQRKLSKLRYSSSSPLTAT